MIKLLESVMKKYLIYSFLTLLILFPCLKSGYLFALDMIFPPKLKFPTDFNLFALALYFLNFILPSQLIQKLILFLILFLAGIGMHQLIPVKQSIPKYFAGIFYMINPFVYSRFLLGQIQLLLAYALFPFLVKLIFDFFSKEKSSNLISLSLFTILIAILSPHFFAFSLIIFFFSFFILAPKFNWKMGFYLIFLISLISLYFIPLISKNQTIIFQESHFQAFTPSSDPKLGLPFNLLALFGSWAERENYYLSLKEINPFWFPLFLILASLVISGIIFSFKEGSNQGKIFFLILIFSFFLALGILKVPGFRDSQKFVALLALSYSWFSAYFLEKLFGWLKEKKITFAYEMGLIFLFLPLIYSKGIFFGFWNQLKPIDYPISWYEINKFLKRDKEPFRILFLPWHQYMYFNFAKKIIANPAPFFFEKQILAGDNIEIDSIYSTSQRPESKYIESLLKVKNSLKNFGKDLSKINVKYILLAKEADWETYLFLDNQEDLDLILENENFKVYLNKIYQSSCSCSDCSTPTASITS